MMLKTKQKKAKKLSNLFFALEIVSVILPFALIVIFNWSDFFKENAFKMSSACILTIGLMLLFVIGVAKKKLTLNYLSLIAGWGTFDLILFLLGNAINSLAVVLLFGLVGLLGAMILDIFSKKYEKQCDEIKDAIKTAEKENMVEQYKKETEAEKVEEKTEKPKTVKVKIKRG